MWQSAVCNPRVEEMGAGGSQLLLDRPFNLLSLRSLGYPIFLKQDKRMDNTRGMIPVVL